MKKMSGSFTGEGLCNELMTKISEIKTLKNNAFVSIEAAIFSTQKHNNWSRNRIQKNP